MSRLNEEIVVRNPGVQGGDEKAVRLAKCQFKREVIDNDQLGRPELSIPWGVKLRRPWSLDIRIQIQIFEGKADVFRGYWLAIGPLEPRSNLELVLGVVI
jgi:hypothetical protein